MAEYDRIQKKQESRTIANNCAGSKQLGGFVDNRNTMFSQKDAMKCTVDDTIQRAVSYEEVAYPANVLAKRRLSKGEFGINADPSFKRNLGYINGVDGVHVNIEGGSHTEKVLLSKKYYDHGTLTNWGDIKRLNRPTPFTLYTERTPCPDCKNALDSNSFTSDNKVQYSFDGNSEEQERWIKDEHADRISELSD